MQLLTLELNRRRLSSTAPNVLTDVLVILIASTDSEQIVLSVFCLPLLHNYSTQFNLLVGLC